MKPIFDKTGFYTAKGECIICNCPPEVAPSLIQFHEDPNGKHETSTCFFSRQPSTPEELSLAIEAMQSSCVSALRYGGNDIKIIKRLVDEGLSHVIDTLHDEKAKKNH